MSFQLNCPSSGESGSAPVEGLAVRRWIRGSLPAWKERRIKELMRSELSSKLSLQRLAAECDLSVRHFTRAFGQSTGLTPHRYLLRLRLDKARELLSDPTLRLHEIALTCGFADQSHFTRVFSASEKVSPGTWRRLNLVADSPEVTRDGESPRG